ncbi:MAG: hypothetical protein JW976_00845 [Syntrophaceae bacterium]|nr:hypothetical protein [Syntrophaceae bacterium]
MTPIESIYEIQSAVLYLQRYLNSSDPVVPKIARMKYKKFINRFFRENVNTTEYEKRDICFGNLDYILNLLESMVEYYYFS